MKIFNIYFLLLWCVTVENNDVTDAPTSVGQQAMDSILGMFWNRFGGETFMGGMSDVYTNKQDSNPVVKTSLGKVKGIATSTVRDRKPYYAFLGIPYAKPPTGERRFKAPEKAEPWKEEILDGTIEGSSCPSFREPAKGNEDCLYLNVFTPSLTPAPGKPVMVFIYGGAFIGGSSNTSMYGPDFLIDRDVVLVTFNYRLGPLGFLSLQNSEVPGNAGLKDQIMALKWVKENIQYFQGDPNRVTIFGESAGAASVCYHILSPLSTGLFQRAIMESGTVLAGWAYTSPEAALEKAFNLGRNVGCIFPVLLQNVGYLHECLKKTPATLLNKVQALSGTKEEGLARLKPLIFVPTMEPEVKGAMITKKPIDYLLAGDFNKVEMIMGVNTQEGLIFYPIMRKLDPTGSILTSILEKELIYLAPEDLVIPENSRSELNQKIKNYYKNGNELTITHLELVQILSDTQFLLPMLRTADLMLRRISLPILVYRFSYDGSYTVIKRGEEFKGVPGTSHADELSYLFNIGALDKVYNHSDRNLPEEKMIEIMTTLWANFAKTGHPAENWSPFTRQMTNYFDLNVHSVTKTSMQKKTVTFWNEIFKSRMGEYVYPE